MTGRQPEAASVAGPVEGGRGWAFGSPADAGEFGCVTEEFLLEGVARRYALVPGSVAGRDGIHTDESGNATGGIRVPDLEAPTAAHSGIRPGVLDTDLEPLRQRGRTISAELWR